MQPTPTFAAKVAFSKGFSNAYLSHNPDQEIRTASIMWNNASKALVTIYSKSNS